MIYCLFQNLFNLGVQELGQDTKVYYKISKEIEGGKSLDTFTYRELMLYRKMPDELFKAIPILILAVIPFGIYLFAIVYFFPRTFLTSHFLSDELQREIYLDRHKKQLKFYGPLLKDMEAQLNPETRKTNPNETKIIQNILQEVCVANINLQINFYKIIYYLNA
ncbi:hypothetical protein FSP39_003229 [Pinctada imbricata]|uniref:Letm1 RBD domain-containing protein n=1 Tax=Pinctada imbricata TaxID=66713 RepID=A0AA88XKF5_PINIB|nr:hypothetical protein FSP39_003229 [Pinctada imbricata]